MADARLKMTIAVLLSPDDLAQLASYREALYADLMSLAEVCELTGITKQRVSNWSNRERDRDAYRFPRPVRKLKGVSVYDRAEILAWMETEEYRKAKEVVKP
jgi:predicted DNA-binding transcriptional regulator AlpA